MGAGTYVAVSQQWTSAPDADISGLPDNPIISASTAPPGDGATQPGPETSRAEALPFVPEDLTQLDVMIADCEPLELGGGAGLGCVDNSPFKDWPIEALESEGYAIPVMAAAAARYYVNQRDHRNAMKWSLRSAALDPSAPDALTYYVEAGLLTHTAKIDPDGNTTYRMDVLQNRYIGEYVLHHLERGDANQIAQRKADLQAAGFERLAELERRAQATLLDMATIETRETGGTWLASRLPGKR